MGVYFSISGLIIISIIAFVFFTKEKVNNKETKIYGRILIAAVAMSLLEIISYLLFKYGNSLDDFIFRFFAKLVPVSYMVINSLFCSYIIYVCYQEKAKYIFLNIAIAIAIVLTMVLPLSFNTAGGSTVPTGYSVYVAYLYCIISMIYQTFLCIKFRKRIATIKVTPFYSFIALGIVNYLITIVNPSAFVIGFIFCITVIIMYFTIENPDIRLVEYEKREKELAVSASEAKSAFLSSMSHELRTPLNAIVGLSEDIMAYQDKVPDEVKEDSVDIVNASNTLLELIGNILDISKIEGGKLELIESDYLPHEEIESLLKIMRTKMEEKDLQFNIFIDPNIPECLYGDRLRIKQIINNFLSNAAKYTEKGSVNFGVRWIDNQLQIRVSDTGRGIKKEDMDKLFEKFERLHVEKSSSVQGTGLGLAITKNLVELMGGKIIVSSVFGKGSTFDVYIPQKLGNKANIVREALSIEDKPVADYTGKKVLVVDDNKLNIKVLRKAIATFNFEIDECYDGLQALDKIANNKYDLILMDIMMPNMGGEETIIKLKENPSFNTPVIALTADATTGAKERYLEEGFNDYLAKPFSRDIIAQKLDYVLGNTK